MANIERRTSFYPKADVGAEECTLKLAHYLPLMDHAFISPTETGLRKSIMDAILGVQCFLRNSNLHDYNAQKQGPDNKVALKAFFVTPQGLVESKATLYRPITKHGDPRIWFSGLRDFADAGNLLLITTIRGDLYITNLSKKGTWDSIADKGVVYGALIKAKQQADTIKDELISLLKQISEEGWLPSITSGDPGVGDTLEHALGIDRNNSKLPDFKGIELKATRLTKEGKQRASTRNTLFTKTPDGGLSYREIVESYGKIQTPRGKSEPRFQLYETFSTKRVNGYGLYLACDDRNKKIEMYHSDIGNVNDPHAKFVSSWDYETLQDSFVQKHPETMWIGAESKCINGVEHFHYIAAQYTNKPNPEALLDLIAKGVITLDLAAHFGKDGKWRDHGMLWKIQPKNRALVVGAVENIKLN
ncbi:MAG: MvaI/BcnI restriction endonuclease family protein [Bacilli bacterium]|nr:MvaI/BcnI restriction endonuclease family protein [Bacilli bacterium]